MEKAERKKRTGGFEDDDDGCRKEERGKRKEEGGRNYYLRSNDKGRRGHVLVTCDWLVKCGLSFLSFPLSISTTRTTRTSSNPYTLISFASLSPQCPWIPTCSYPLLCWQWLPSNKAIKEHTRIGSSSPFFFFFLQFEYSSCKATTSLDRNIIHYYLCYVPSAVTVMMNEFQCMMLKYTKLL